MVKNNKISLVIPCRNEEKGLKALLPKVPPYIDEIIVVDNKSTDNTAEVAKQFNTTVVRENRTWDGIGYGFAHQKGMKIAKGDYIVSMDGDNTYPVESIGNIVNFMDENKIDFVSCNRLPLMDIKALPAMNIIGILILNLETMLLYGYYIHDILSGMWVVKKDILKKLNLTMGDWNISPEIKLAALVNKDIRFVEYHIKHFKRLAGFSKQMYWKTGINHVLYILKRRFTTDNPLKGVTISPVINYCFRLAKNVINL